MISAEPSQWSIIVVSEIVNVNKCQQKVNKIDYCTIRILIFFNISKVIADEYHFLLNLSIIK